MTFRRRQVIAARLGATLAAICGAVGFLGGLAQLPWKLGVIGWLNGGLLLGVISLIVLVDTHLAAKR